MSTFDRALSKRTANDAVTSPGFIPPLGLLENGAVRNNRSEPGRMQEQ